jgi:hypothetical protein
VTMKPKDAVEVLRRLRERLESAHQDLSDDERMALDYATQELRAWKDSRTTARTMPDKRLRARCR